MQHLHRHDDGSITVMVAVLLPMLLVLFGAASGALVISGGERELQRAASAAATGAATQIDAVSASALASLLALPGGGGVVADACSVAGDNLEHAPVLIGFSDINGSCNGSPEAGTATVTVTTELDGIGLSLQRIDQALAAHVDPATGLLPEHELDALPAFVAGVDQLSATALLAQLVPSVITPRVRVTTDSALDTPLGDLLRATPAADIPVEATAVARRRLKNVVVLPTTNMVCTVTPTLLGTPVPVVGSPADIVESTLAGGDTTILSDALAAVGLSDPLLDLVGLLQAELAALLAGQPTLLLGDCEPFDLNQPADVAAQALFDSISTLRASSLMGLLDGVLGQPGLTTCLLNGVETELRDVVDPLDDDEAAPTLEQIRAAAEYNNEPVLVYVAGLTNATGIPLLDVIPVAADELDALLTGDLDSVTEVAALGGLYRTSLIEESPFDEAPLQPGC